jgi:hypothetical protein
MDESNQQLYVTLWGEFPSIQAQIGSIIGLKGAKVSNYNGTSLNINHGIGHLELSPVHYRSQQLQKFINNKKHSDKSKLNQALCTPFKKGKFTKIEKISTIEEIIDTLVKEWQTQQKTGVSKLNRLLRDIDETEVKYFTTYTYIQHISPTQQLLYNACPSCRKKVTKQTSKDASFGFTSLDTNSLTPSTATTTQKPAYFCYTCQKFYTKATPTYSLTCLLSDSTDLIPATFFSQTAQTLLKTPAKTIRTLQEKQDLAEIEQLFSDKVYFRLYKVKLRVTHNKRALYFDKEEKVKAKMRLAMEGGYRERVKELYVMQGVGVEEVDWEEFGKWKSGRIRRKMEGV